MSEDLKAGDVRTIDGKSCRFVEYDDRGEVWEVIGWFDATPKPASPGEREITDDILEQMARAHDAEESAQRGEPSPWRDDIAGNDPEFRSERIFAMREAVKVLFAARDKGSEG